MTSAALMVEIHRGPILESVHHGHAVICDGSGDVLEMWGDGDTLMLPRSSAKMIQAVPLVASGAARVAGLDDRHLALACASHQGASEHVQLVSDWLAARGLHEADLKCGPQPSRDKALRFDMIRTSRTPSRVMNNCSGKHTGFLTVAQHLGAGLDYVDPAHPLQRTILETFETVTGDVSPGHGIDGCSAPNFASSITGMARAMAYFASAHTREDVLSRAAAALVTAMYHHPRLVAGEGRACTLLMQAAREPVAIKTGAEGYFVAILPNRGIGIALKIADGATRASECAMAALLVRLGVVEATDPNVVRFLSPQITNWDGLVTGHMCPAPGLMA